MQLLKRIDQKLMGWFTTRLYGYKLDHKKHTRMIIANMIVASLLTIDILINGWSFPNTVGVVILWPAVFYEGRLWLRLRAEREMEGHEVELGGER